VDAADRTSVSASDKSERDVDNSGMTVKPELTPIESSMFSHHAYDPDSRKMTVRYKNGTLWEYDDVPIDKHATFTESASPGRFFNERIKPNHIGRKVKE
jgi:hypothetical protein